jgi:hypothetical protein
MRDGQGRIQLPVVAQPKGRMTEREVRMAGAAANRLIQLREALTRCERGGTLSVSGSTGAAMNLSLTTDDLQALLSLLMQRAGGVLIGLDVELDHPLP